ncbi:MAG: TIGR02530 family flagellar biosynthesis protein [Eubacterium sp.]|nr:TIGR02530 family flagellar biosynthesis protein [Eubacterium sp.]
MIHVKQSYSTIHGIRQVVQDEPAKKVAKQESEKDFGQVFSQKMEEVQFSKHAARRLETRNIQMSDEVKARLQDATSQAREKGMKESLVLVDDLAFIVNVKNNTVVTAVNDVDRGVFTNIDGAIIN